jgi:hypothetical protein
MNRQVYLSISQLAILIDKSPYGSLTDIIYNLWLKVDSNGYNKKVRDMEYKYNKSFKKLTEADKFDILSKEFGLELDSKLVNSMKNNDHNLLLNQQSEMINDINNINNPNIDDLVNKKTELIKMVNSFSNRGFGQFNESVAINNYAKITNSTISNKQKTIVAKFKTVNDVDWYIKGKIDGISLSCDNVTRIIEIKNRTKCLFNELKDYEKPQIQTYMKLFDIHKGHMVECLRKGTNENELNIIDVEFEKDYWDLIKNNLIKFIDFFYNFLENPKLQELLIKNNASCVNNTNNNIEQDFRELLKEKLAS